MDNDLFLKKFQGRSETIGREGILGIMNNVHISVNDKPNKKQPDIRTKIINKQKSPKKENDYKENEIQKVFNQNKNYILKSQPLSLASKLNNQNQKSNKKISENIHNTKINIHQKDNSLKDNKIIKLKYVQGVNNNINVNEKDKPVKLFKAKTINDNNKSQEKKQPENNNNQKFIKKQNSIKLPKISHPANGAKTPIITNKLLGRINSKSVRKTFDNYVKNNINYSNVKSYKIQQDFDNKIKLPKIIPQKKNNHKSSNNIFENINIKSVNLKENNNKKKKENNVNNEIVKNIKNEFLWLDSIKNKANTIKKSNSLKYYRLNGNEGKNKNYNIKKTITNPNDIRPKEKNIDNISNKINKIQKENNKNDNMNKKYISNSAKTKKINNYTRNNNNQFDMNYLNNNINIYNNMDINNMNNMNSLMMNNNQNNIQYMNPIMNNNIQYINPNMNYNMNYNINPNMNYNMNNYDVNNYKMNYNMNYNINPNMYYNMNNYDINNYEMNYNMNNNNNQSYERQRDFESFNVGPNLSPIKGKLPVINEEEEDNKYNTEFYGKNEEEENELQKLMKQRMNFQNKISSNSRFKLKNNFDG